ncbi:DUF927 domain-containing protein [Roseovarius tibetensis]|uniref:DUF927 domain-containing protein n=1 Tax=Roseovarius tibetensis TaxID=2685897 RepID=UPI003D7FFDA9
MSDNTTEPDVPAANEAPPASEMETDPVVRDLDARLPSGYDLDGHMIVKLKSAGRSRPLCGPVIVRSHARTATGAGWCAELAFRSVDGTWQSAVVAMRDLLGAPGRVVARLVDRGFDLRGRPKEVCDMLRAMPVDRIGLAVEVTGWVGDGFDTFICPTGEIVTDARAPREVLFSGRPRVTAPSSDRCVEEAWEAALFDAGMSDAMTVGLCAALAPVILPVSGAPSFLLHAHGNETAGRIMRTVAAGLWGPPAQLTLGWRDPLPRILAEIEAARDGLVVLEGYEPRHHRKVPAVTEALAAMEAKGRVVVLSTGMTPLVPTDGRASSVQDFRHVVDVDTRSWDTERADEIMETAASNSGVFGPGFVRSAINWGIGNQRIFLEIRTDDIRDVLTEKDTVPVDAETDRVCRVIGALHGTGAVLEKQKLVPGMKRPKSLCQRLFKEWVARHRGVLSSQDRALLSKAATEIRRLLREDALTPLDTADAVVPLSDVGWHDDHAVYLTVRTMTAVATAGEASLERLIDLLIAQDLLRPGRERGNQFRLPSRVPGRPRAYKIRRPEILRFATAGHGDADDRAGG